MTTLPVSTGTAFQALILQILGQRIDGSREVLRGRVHGNAAAGSGEARGAKRRRRGIEESRRVKMEFGRTAERGGEGRE